MSQGSVEWQGTVKAQGTVQTQGTADRATRCRRPVAEDAIRSAVDEFYARVVFPATAAA